MGKVSRSTLHKAILEAWECAFAGSPVTYLSGPITTGMRQVERLRARESGPGTKHEIIRENSKALIETARKLRTDRLAVIVEPASLNVEQWSQADYLQLWEDFIERHVRSIIFMPEWEYSIGCATEFARAVMHDIRMETVSGSPITPEDGVALLRAAYDNLISDDADGALIELADRINGVILRVSSQLKPATVTSRELRKDASLDHLAQIGMNVAQFVSFSPGVRGPVQEYSRLSDVAANHTFKNVHMAVQTVLERSADSSVNVRSYEPFNPQSREFVYGLKSVDDAVGALNRLTAEGLHTIVNETIDIHDGGVSGVLMGNVLEFAPDDTPRCVEKPGTASLPRGWGRELLSTVYRFPVDLAVPFASRLEFSLHPAPRGWKQTNILVWEFAEEESPDARPQLQWPNNFSRLIGDKVFGLLVARHLGLPVPETTVINRRIAPFTFGLPTGWGETWIRTAPVEQVPGKFTTHRGWSDPYALLASEDRTGKQIASVVAQQGIQPVYSGALIVGPNSKPIIEGKAGEGETLMLGQSAPQDLPAKVRNSVRSVFEHARAALGAVRLEWVFDGERVWVVQLHRGATETTKTQITSHAAEHWVPFDVAQGLEALRSLIANLDGDTGVEVRGRVGLTSHIADVIRKANVPARMVA
jgi:hypothetical protein